MVRSDNVNLLIMHGQAIELSPGQSAQEQMYRAEEGNVLPCIADGDTESITDDEMMSLLCLHNVM